MANHGSIPRVRSDRELLELLGRDLYASLDENGCGYIEITEEEILEALDKAEGEDTKEKLDHMLQQVKENGGYVYANYWCF